MTRESINRLMTEMCALHIDAVGERSGHDYLYDRERRKKEFGTRLKRADRLQVEKSAIRQGLKDLVPETHGIHSNERGFTLSFWTVCTKQLGLQRVNIST